MGVMTYIATTTILAGIIFTEVDDIITNETSVGIATLARIIIDQILQQTHGLIYRIVIGEMIDTYCAHSSMVTWVRDTLIDFYLTVVSFISIHAGTSVASQHVLKKSSLIIYIRSNPSN